MLTRLPGILSAFLMALPMCWCCMVQALPVKAAVEETCMACHKFALADETPAKPAHDCHCRADSTQRDLSPNTATAPRLVLVDLQAAVWGQSEVVVLPPIGRELNDPTHLHSAGSPPRSHFPLYHRDCALLI